MNSYAEKLNAFADKYAEAMQELENVADWLESECEDDGQLGTANFKRGKDEAFGECRNKLLAVIKMFPGTQL
jgi:hypothetical protein